MIIRVNDCPAVEYHGAERYCTWDKMKSCQHTIKENCPLYRLEIKPKQDIQEERRFS